MASGLLSKKIKDVTILKITQEHPLLSGCFLVVGYNLFRIEIKRYAYFRNIESEGRVIYG